MTSTATASTQLCDGNSAITQVAYAASSALIVCSMCKGRAYLGYEARDYLAQERKNFKDELPILDVMQSSLGYMYLYYFWQLHI